MPAYRGDMRRVAGSPLPLFRWRPVAGAARETAWKRKTAWLWHEDAAVTYSRNRFAVAMRPLLVVLALAGVREAVAEPVPETAPAASGLDAEQKVMLSRLAGVGTILGWGLLQWEYGEQPLNAISEGWFERDTQEGGADKLGHLYTGYVLSRGFGALYRHWGVDPDRAAAQAAVTSLLVTGTMELGDGFSPYGVSWEDMVMNTAGAWAGYALMRNEALRDKVDLRVEYRFNTDTGDPSTDYQHSRYLLALKLGGFEALRDTPLQWLELQGGYYARGYGDPLAPDERTAYVGLGLNLSRLAARGGLRRTATFLQFYQPPDTTARLEDTWR